MSFLPLQKRILELSSKLVSTENGDDFERIASELKAVLHQHAEDLKKMTDETKILLNANHH